MLDVRQKRLAQKLMNCRRTYSPKVEVAVAVVVARIMVVVVADLAEVVEGEAKLLPLFQSSSKQWEMIAAARKMAQMPPTIKSRVRSPASITSGSTTTLSIQTMKTMTPSPGRVTTPPLDRQRVQHQRPNLRDAKLV